MSGLGELREQLNQTNLEIFKLFKSRRVLSSEIQRLKKLEAKETFDPEREIFLFKNNFSAFEGLSLGELKAFSLLMEAQAGEDYPAWSDGIHLVKNSNAPKLNPLMLLLFYPEKIMVDDLKSDYKFLVALAEG